MAEECSYYGRHSSVFFGENDMISGIVEPPLLMYNSHIVE